MTQWLMIISVLFSVLFTLTSPMANAQWYEAQGRGYIYNDNEKLARTQAMENALKKALLVSGASVSSVRQVVNGLLTQDELSIRASGTVNSFELVDETYIDNMVNVTIRADIFPQDKHCFSADYKKSLLITRSHLINREQANIGGLYNLDKVAMDKLSQQVSSDGRYIDTRLATQSKNNFYRLNKSLNTEAIKSLAMSLSNITDSQFIFFSEIQDISLIEEESSSWHMFSDKSYNRQFQIEVFVYSGSSGELVFNKQYQSMAPWTYPLSQQVDINTVNFWQQNYGNAILLTFDNIVTDIDDTMMCHTTQATIVKADRNKVTLNLGKKNGVKIGDKFSLLHSSNFTNQDGKTYPGFNISNSKVTITQVFENSAVAESESGELFDNIQINDLAIRH